MIEILALFEREHNRRQTARQNRHRELEILLGFGAQFGDLRRLFGGRQVLVGRQRIAFE